jgi:PAS domain S-box-containing protein
VVSITGTHDATLVALSVFVATAASYTALDLAGRIRASSGWPCYAWLATSAVAMGGGIWSMHFVAMLAFSMPGMEVNYDIPLTALSLVLAIVVTGIGLYAVSRKEATPRILLFSGSFVGLGIVAMHYTGMAAMRMGAHLSYDTLWVAVSVLIAIGAATVALWLAFQNTGLVQKLVAAVAMGLAISGMHYAAMQAAVFTAHSGVDRAHGHASLAQTTLAIAVSGATLLILFLALVAAMFDRRFAMLAEREAQALRESEERFRSLYRKTPLPLHSLDGGGLVEHVSDAWLDLLGYVREEVKGRPLTEFMTEASARRRAKVDWPGLLKLGELKDAEYRFVTKTEDVLDAVLSEQVETGTGGQFVRVVGGLLDVTARRRAEAALRQSQKIEAIGHLTGGVAHDFNNLLAVVLGNLELLRKRLPEDARTRALLENAIEGAQRGAALTQRMLAFARRQDLNPQPVDVSALVRGMADLLQRSIGPTVRIETHFPLRLRPALVDANQLELALLNLVVNARDAMPDGGTITISGREEGPGPFIHLCVTDTGEGMDEATLARATEPFFTTKGTGKGTGLGLSMVHGLAEQSGGGFALRSRKGEGTTAEIWLPLAEVRAMAEPSAPEAKHASPAEPDRRLTVLVVDDDPLVLANTAAMLEDLGHTALQAASGAEALEILRQAQAVDLVLTDQVMPKMTGAQLIAAIRAERPQLPLIIATGFAELPADLDPHLPKLRKPFDQGLLARTIDASLRQAADKQTVVAFRQRRG